MEIITVAVEGWSIHITVSGEWYTVDGYRGEMHFQESNKGDAVKAFTRVLEFVKG